VNRITANNGEWTADRNGYVLLGAETTASGSNNYLSTQFSINNKVIAKAVPMFAAAQSWSMRYSDVFAVKAGDIIKITTDANTSNAITYYCYFIPVVSSNFNVFPDWSNPSNENNVTISNLQTGGLIFTAPKDGNYTVWAQGLTDQAVYYFANNASMNDNRFYAGSQNGINYAHLSINVRQGDSLYARGKFGVIATNIVFKWYHRPNHVSVTNAASAWVNVPLTRMNGFTAGTAELKYNASLGAFKLYLNGAGSTSAIAANTNILSFTNPTSITRASRNMSVFQTSNASPTMPMNKLNANATSYISTSGESVVANRTLYGEVVFFIEE